MLRCFIRVLIVVSVLLVFVSLTMLSAGANETMQRRHEHVAKIAENQLGDPYSWGAAGPDAFDCSGLAMYSWNVYRGIPHNAAAQFAALPPIAEEFIMQGDLVYFDFDGGDIDHVGVLVNPHRMIHASDQVEADDLSGVYGNSSIVGYRRPDRH